MSQGELTGPDGRAPGTVILAARHGDEPEEQSGAADWNPAALTLLYRLLVEVTDRSQALRAVAAGAHGLIARGAESGGVTGESGSFVLLQQLLAEPGIRIPVWACGGIGPRTAAAAVAGGAAGVVLDSQLALLDESEASEEAVAALHTMDGSETEVVAGRRVLRPGPSRPPSASPVSAATSGDRRDLPVGQDGFLAQRFTQRWQSVSRAVRGLRADIEDAVKGLREGGAVDSLLGPGTRMSKALGTQLPVVQGPMTRVSDQPRFADAVARAGGLPVVALALAGAEAAHDLLGRSAAELGSSPWGVGLLGFAPDEVWSAQMEAVLRTRPTHAVIAGGRPSQARMLEEAGIRTFLHVPSPGLLRQFLEAGARRFVFEGAECGGHIGPRYSFALWEAQIAVLEDFLVGGSAGGGVEVLFAGGVHDARSAAMVAALAAPLAERGVAIGVLMGTAYLFTHEAVECGAVKAGFQHQVVAAEETVVLRTAPGHATRCLPSPFTAEFGARKQALLDDGQPETAVWEDLERLNVGRLRIASKGLDRTDGKLIPVGEADQFARGLFMAGQVATLRADTTTIADLHTSVTTEAAAFLTGRLAQLADRMEPQPAADVPDPLDVAVVGMSCMFPEAPDLATFWSNVVTGVDAITEVPAERWDTEVYYAREAGPGKVVSKWGGFLPRIPFDALRYGIPPTALSSIEPVQLLALEAARRALQDAGYAESDDGRPARPWDRSRTSVVFGAEAGSDLSHNAVLSALLPGYFDRVPKALADQLPALTEDSFPGMLANVISGRIANRLDLGGSNFTVDAACASSLAALDVACRQLAAGAADVALCGGADLHNGINDYLLFGSVRALSPSGRSRPFDAAADGIALGEGIGCLVLKRLADAERDGDRVYAVVAGIGSASDGRAQGLTAPRPEGQRSALERAYRDAGVSPADVGLVEAHGTGTVVGDRTELATLTAVFEESGAAPGSCTLGSVKSQIGHTKCAAGIAGVIKAAMALRTGTLPPTLHVTRPHDAWRPGSPFAFRDRAGPWPAPMAERLAGVSAFGFGGTNFHVVLRGHDSPPPTHGRWFWPAELFLLRGADRTAAVQQAAELLSLAESCTGAPALPGHRLRDLALVASRRAERRRHTAVQHAIVARDIPHLASLLRRVVDGRGGEPSAGLHAADDTARGQAQSTVGGPPEVALLFPGQGSQHPYMLAELLTTFPWLRSPFEGGRALRGVLYPPMALGGVSAADQLAAVTDTRVAQPGLGIVGLAAFDLLERAGVRPAMAGGHSYGEVVALCAAGAFDSRELVALSEARAEAVLGALGDDPGTMAAVSAAAAETNRVLAGTGLTGRVVTANDNAPRQTVISGPTEDVHAAVRALRDAGLGVQLLPVACAFHSPLIADAAPQFAEVLADRTFRAPEFPVWGNRNARPYPADPDAIRAELSQQLVSPVRFADQIEAMYEAGARVFVEAGPGSVLSRLVPAILGDRPHLAVPLEGRAGGLLGFLDTLARLAVAGVPVRTGWLHSGRDAVAAEHPRRSGLPGWTVDGQTVRTATGDPLPGAVAPARRIQESVVSTSTPQAGPLPGDDVETGRDALVAEFIRTSRELIAAQRDVLLTHLGGADADGELIRPDAPPRPAEPAHPLGGPRQDITPSHHEAPAPEGQDAERPGIGPSALMAVIVGVISERTGYPADLIEPELDLEADLSIDSIKRTEIVGELGRQLAVQHPGLAIAELPDEDLQELARARTAQALTSWLAARLLPAEEDRHPGSEEPPDTEDAGHGSTDASPLHAARDVGTEALAPVRFHEERVPLKGVRHDPEAVREALDGKRFLLVGNGEVTGPLEQRLTAQGALVVTLPDSHAIGQIHGLVHGVVLLDAWEPSGPPVLPGSAEALQRILALDPRLLLAVRPRWGGDIPEESAARTDGLRGLFRTIAREHPETVTRLAELDAATSPGTMADLLFGELLSTDDEPVVARGAAGRYGFRLLEAPLEAAGAEGEGDAEAAAAALGLGPDSVVLLVGGGRGITATVATTLASAARCRLEILGRTPLPDRPESPEIAASADRPALRTALAAQGMPVGEIDAAVGRILAQREVAATIRELTDAGASVRYQVVDVGDARAVRMAVQVIHAEYGRLDGVIHAAGVIEDRLFADKEPASFHRVYDSKAVGARNVLTAVAELPDPPGFTVLFGSIAAVLGNRGQADYAAGNDAMESLAARWARHTGHRALTVHWGPWAPSPDHPGMVSEELGRAYVQRGVRLIEPGAGALALLRELAWGEKSSRSVVYTVSGW
ncbi:SDR family oxidoreductase [Streptomyces mauvecolor]